MVVFQAIYTSLCSNLEQYRWREKVWEAKLKEQGELLKKYEEGLSRSPSPASSPQGNTPSTPTLPLPPPVRMI
jgi:hypothetical protein